MELNLFYKLSMRILAELLDTYSLSCLQIGAGAGSGDVRCDTPDGFQELVQNTCKYTPGTVHLYEPNPICIPTLSNEWQSISNAKIWNEGVLDKQDGNGTLRFFMHPLDQPFYQVCSTSPEHVLSHYQSSSFKDLISCDVKCVSLDTAIERILLESTSDIFISIDAEGMDGKMARALLTSPYLARVKAFSIEYLHLTQHEKQEIKEAATRNSFTMLGYGVDQHCWDRLFISRAMLRMSGLELLPNTTLIN